MLKRKKLSLEKNTILLHGRYATLAEALELILLQLSSFLDNSLVWNIFYRQEHHTSSDLCRKEIQKRKLKDMGLILQKEKECLLK